MKVLLVGEYSRLHNTLKEGLKDLGHEVTIIGNGDGFKKYPVDIDISNTILSLKFLKPFRKLVHRLFKFDFADVETWFRFKKQLQSLKGFDVVQLINEDALSIHPKLQIPLLKQLFSQNDKIFLLCSGEDHVTINHYINGKERYSVLTPLLQDKSLKKHFSYSLKYLSPPYQRLHNFIYDSIKGVIATDLDYHLPLKNHPKYLGLIPNPVNTDSINYSGLTIEGPIKIFHGVNKLSAIKKGSEIISKALNKIKDKYGDKVKVITVSNVPYKEYIKLYDSAHILMDQTYGFDQGYNALEGMAKGKVVFTGAEQEWLEYYNLKKDTVAINALPVEEKIVEKLEWLINNPEQIAIISKNARQFIEREHHFVKSAKKYVSQYSK